MWAWFVGSKVGRALLGAMSAVVVIALLLLRAFNAGKQSQKHKEEEKALENLRRRNETHEEISRMPADDRRAELSKWVRDDE